MNIAVVIVIVSVLATGISQQVTTTGSSKLDALLEKICSKGELYESLPRLRKFSDNAAALHSLSALETILHANITGAVALHRQGKLLSPTTIPPLAQMHLSGKSCGGLGDLFYITAVIIKQMVDSNIEPAKWQDALTTLLTLSADSGLHAAAETHLQTALALSPDDTALLFRAALMTPGVFESMQHLTETRERLVERVDRLYAASDSTALKLKSLDEFVLSPTFYYVYQGLNDRDLLQKLQAAYASAYPLFVESEPADSLLRERQYWHQQNALSPHTIHYLAETMDVEGDTAASDEEFVPPAPEEVTHEGRVGAFSAPTMGDSLRRLRVGFVSSHFRRHSICKLYCGVITNMDPERFEVFVFSSLSQDAEDDTTRALRAHAKDKQNHFHFIPIGKTFVQNRNEVTDRRIDVLIYLDVGMDPSTTAWAAARLAPVQGCLWGHPSTTGLPSLDFYFSSSDFHLSPSVAGKGSAVEHAQSLYLEQLVQFDTDSLGFHFARPSLAAVLGLSEGEREREAELLAERPAWFFEKIGLHLRGKNSPGAKALLKLLQVRLSAKGERDRATVLLCPQHMPKFHPQFDSALLQPLLANPKAVVVLIDQEKKSQWKKILTTRWAHETHRLLSESHQTGDLMKVAKAVLDRVLWMPSLSPEEYLIMLALGDVMLDPFPFGGGVTTLESLAVCTPVLTLPAQQNVPQLAAGMLRSLHLSPHLESLLVLSRTEDFVHHVEEILQIEGGLRGEICDRVVRGERLFSDLVTVREWERFLLRAMRSLA